MAATATSAPVKRSWADIVRGSAAPTPLDAEISTLSNPSEMEASLAMAVEDGTSLQPSKRGERRCHCQGEILVMLGHYGWIMTFDAIDHPDVWKTAGRVYVHKRDLVKSASPAQGDIVSFYLYSDDQGLGAELCQLEQRSSQGMCADADEFISMGCSQLKATPPQHLVFKAPKPSWNVGASEFAPSSFNAQAAEFVPGPVGNALAMQMFLQDAMSDDESDDDESTSGMDGDKEINSSDDEKESIQSYSQYDQVDARSAGLKDVVVKGRFSISIKPAQDSTDVSTNAGSSESETEDTMRLAVMPPPGLSSPLCFRPPPGLEDERGLSMPALVA